jgi:myxalamid-type polyketide synthase MxaE and MxaD
MSARGARHLALMSRRELNATSRAELAALADRGVTATHYRGDVGNLEDVAGVLNEIGACSWPLRGIVHSAGILLDGSLMHAAWDDFDRVLRPKVDGAWHLHALTAEQPLDFFVLFSSAASILGSPGQANYCAANAFLDALAAYRAAQGLPAVSINWGPWSAIGAAAGAAVSARLARHGIGSMTPDEGLSILEYAMTGSTIQIGALPVDWSSLVDRYPRRTEPRFFSRIADAETARRAPAGVAATPPARAFPAHAPVAERSAWLHDYLTERIGAALQQPGSQISLTKPLNHMGLDSLMAIEIRNRIKTDLGLDVPVVTFLDGASIAVLARTLAQAAQRAPHTDAPTSSAPRATGSTSEFYSLAPEISPAVATQLLSRLTDLTADQVDALLSGVAPAPPGEEA